jgi:S-(hydroxymethyl)glutathione dehydrogenase / alcohol dehydrogenase
VQAVVARESGARPELSQIERREVASGEVRVRLAAAGVCHSDLSMVNGTVVPRYPVVLGHEASGVVTEVAADVSDVKPGDKVVLNWAPACRTCWFCAHGEPWLCEASSRVMGTPMGEFEDQQLFAALGVGAFAEETVLAGHAVVPVPDDVPLELAALLGCAVITGVGAVRNAAAVGAGESVLVLGLGGIGLAAVAGARLAGAAPIIAADVSAEKEELARAMGATDFLVNDGSLGKSVRALTDGRGADYSFECVGSGDTIRTAWQAVRRGGRCTIVGVGKRSDEIRFNAMELFHFNRILTSSIYGSGDPARDVPILAAHVRAGDLDLGKLITHRIELADAPDALERMALGREVGRSLIVFPSDSTS